MTDWRRDQGREARIGWTGPQGGVLDGTTRVQVSQQTAGWFTWPFSFLPEDPRPLLILLCWHSGVSLLRHPTGPARPSRDALVKHVSIPSDPRGHAEVPDQYLGNRKICNHPPVKQHSPSRRTFIITHLSIFDLYSKNSKILLERPHDLAACSLSFYEKLFYETSSNQRLTHEES